MPPNSPLSREARIYLALWRKAATDGQLILSFPSRREQNAAFMGLYRAIRPFRQDPEMDQELGLIAERFSVKRLSEDRLVIESKVALEVALSLASSLGLSSEDLLTPAERSLQARMAGELASMKDAPATEQPLRLAVVSKPSTPFYTRD